MVILKHFHIFLNSSTSHMWHVTCDMWHVIRAGILFQLGSQNLDIICQHCFRSCSVKTFSPIICFFFQFLHCTEVWPLWKCARNVSFFYSAARFKRAIYCCAKLSGRLPSLCNFLGPTIRQETNDFFSRWMGRGGYWTLYFTLVSNSCNVSGGSIWLVEPC